MKAEEKKKKEEVKAGEKKKKEVKKVLQENKVQYLYVASYAGWPHVSVVWKTPIYIRKFDICEERNQMSGKILSEKAVYC